MVARYGTFNRMFQLHHVIPSTKNAEYTKLISRNISSEQLDEIDKCVLLCAQCHSIIHVQEITAKLKLSIEIEGRNIDQNFEGWIKADLKERTFTFITNQRYLLQICDVVIGTKEPLVMAVIEIERKENLTDWLKNISTYKTIKIISNSDKKLLMCIEHIEKNSAKITQAIGFPVTAIDYASKGSNKNDIWFRNGYVLKKSGEIYTTGSISYNCNLLV